MDKRLRKYHYAASLNLFFWGPVVVLLLFPGAAPDDFPRYLKLIAVGGGVLLAALLQHWTYYDVYNAKTRLSTSPANDRGT